MAVGRGELAGNFDRGAGNPFLQLPARSGRRLRFRERYQYFGCFVPQLVECLAVGGEAKCRSWHAPDICGRQAPLQCACERAWPPVETQVDDQVRRQHADEAP